MRDPPGHSVKLWSPEKLARNESGLVLPSRELKLSSVLKLEKFSLGVFGKVCACGWMYTYHNNEGNKASVGVCPDKYHLIRFNADST